MLDHPVDFYADPLVYDVLHAHGTAADVDALERLERRFVGPVRGRATWLEPACGTARYLLLASRRGRRCVGFDLEPRMIAYARERAEALPAAIRPRLFVADMTSFDGGGRLRTRSC